MSTLLKCIYLLFEQRFKKGSIQKKSLVVTSPDNAFINDVRGKSRFAQEDYLQAQKPFSFSAIYPRWSEKPPVFHHFFRLLYSGNRCGLSPLLNRTHLGVSSEVIDVYENPQSCVSQIW
jgi:hypothetical protein